VPNATERVILIRRISKVTAGGKHLRFNALAALGDGQGHVGIGLGKADAVPDAVRKAVTIARANMIRITRRGSTIPHAIQSKYGASEVMLRPAVQGTGVKAGATVRAIMELAGLRDILTKSMGNPNPINLAKATMTALASLQDTGRGRESEREADGSADAAAETNGSGPGEGSSAQRSA
jgi:small subunit ribosomal protein S5